MIALLRFKLQTRIFQCTGMAIKNCTLRQSAITFFCIEITNNLKFLPFFYNDILRSSLKFYKEQCRSTPTSGPPPPKVSARAPAHRSYHFRGVKLKSCIKKIHHNLYISKQANV